MKWIPCFVNIGFSLIHASNTKNSNHNKAVAISNIYILCQMMYINVYINIYKPELMTYCLSNTIWGMKAVVRVSMI